MDTLFAHSSSTCVLLTHDVLGMAPGARGLGTAEQDPHPALMELVWGQAISKNINTCIIQLQEKRSVIIWVEVRRIKNNEEG